MQLNTSLSAIIYLHLYNQYRCTCKLSVIMLIVCVLSTINTAFHLNLIILRLEC